MVLVIKPVRIPMSTNHQGPRMKLICLPKTVLERSETLRENRGEHRGPEWMPAPTPIALSSLHTISTSQRMTTRNNPRPATEDHPTRVEVKVTSVHAAPGHLTL